MQLSLKNTAALAAAALSALALTGCAGSPDTTDASDVGDDQTVALSVGYIPVGVYAYFWQAEEAGYFADAGLDVELVAMAGGSEIIPALQSGSVQFGISDAMGVISAASQGIGVEYVTFNASQTSDSPIHAVVAADPDITSAADLNGRTVATNSSYNTDWIMMRQWLEQGGADLDSITFVEMSFVDQLAALRSGTIDAAGMLEPFVTQAENDGLTVIGHYFTDVESPSVLSGVAAMTAYVEANPGVVERFVGAIERAVDDFNADPQIARDVIAANTAIEPAVVETMNLPIWRNDTDVTQMEFWVTAAEAEGILETDLDPATLLWSRDN